MSEKVIAGKFNDELAEKIPWRTWSDYPDNPIIKPLFGDVVADPTVLNPSESHDGRWHMFLCATWNLIVHMVSDDGINWQPLEHYDWTGFSPFMFKEDGKYYLFYQRMERLTDTCSIACRVSEDLNNWSERHDIIKPELDWENMDLRPTVRNACVMKTPQNKYRLYYSGGVKILDDLGFEEPAYVGMAEADNILGPYVKRPEPILVPHKKDPWRNIGCGGMKVCYLEDQKIYLGFNNGIYSDEQNHSRSAIHMLVSEDGLEWFDVPGNPILSCQPGWKESLVYQLCLVNEKGKLWVYYNCREGWKKGIERIGLAISNEGI